MKPISIREQDEFIKLGQALKKANHVSSGVEAKIVIQDGQVTVCLLYTSAVLQFSDPK